MAIEKLTEFAKDGQKNVDGLTETDGFPVLTKPARQWFNYLFNSLTTKINEIIDKKLDLSGGSLTGVINEAAGAAIASASTVDLTNSTGNFVHITGTTSITAINLAQGASRRVVFDGVLTLTNGANLILPGGANITTAADDAAIFVGDASSVVRCIAYVPASGKPVVLPSATTLVSGIVQLNDGLASTSVTQALTANQGKALNDSKLNTVDLQKNTPVTSSAGGTADAITASYIPAITTLSNGMSLFVRAASANTTTTPTFTPNSGTIAAKTIVKGNGLALDAGDIAGGGHWIELQYDATLDKWVLQNPAKGIFAISAATESTAGIAKIATTAQAKALTDDTTIMTPAKIPSALNATGFAPLYACRAWVNFNGQGTVAIRGSGNVSSITDNGTGKYTINFGTNMPNIDYAVTTAVDNQGAAGIQGAQTTGYALDNCTINVRNAQNSAQIDNAYVNVIVVG